MKNTAPCHEKKVVRRSFNTNFKSRNRPKNMPEGGVVLRPLKATQLMLNSTVG